MVPSNHIIHLCGASVITSLFFIIRMLHKPQSSYNAFVPLSASFSSYQHKKGMITVDCGAKYNFSISLLRFDFEFEASGLLQTDLLPLHIQYTLTGSNTCSICGLIDHNNVVFRTEMLMQSYCTCMYNVRTPSHE